MHKVHFGHVSSETQKEPSTVFSLSEVDVGLDNIKQEYKKEKIALRKVPRDWQRNKESTGF